LRRPDLTVGFRPNPFASGYRLREWYRDTSPGVELGEFRRMVRDGPVQQSPYYPQVGSADWALEHDPSRDAHREAVAAWMRENGIEGEPVQVRERVLHYRPGASAARTTTSRIRRPRCCT
jgi:hypothetical protein